MRTILLLGCVIALTACGRTVTAPETACSTTATVKTYPIRNAVGDSVGVVRIISPATCPSAR